MNKDTCKYCVKSRQGDLPICDYDDYPCILMYNTDTNPTTCDLYEEK